MDFKTIEKYDYEIISLIIVVFTTIYSITQTTFFEKIKYYSKNINSLTLLSIYIFTSLVIYIIFSTNKKTTPLRFRYKKEISFWNNIGLGLIFIISLDYIWTTKKSINPSLPPLNEFIILFLLLCFYTGYYILSTKNNLFLEAIGIIKNKIDKDLSEHSSKITGMSIMITSLLFFMYYLKTPEYFNEKPLILIYWVIIILLLIIFFDAIQIIATKQMMSRKFTHK